MTTATYLLILTITLFVIHIYVANKKIGQLKAKNKNLEAHIEALINSKDVLRNNLAAEIKSLEEEVVYQIEEREKLSNENLKLRVSFFSLKKKQKLKSKKESLKKLVKTLPKSSLDLPKAEVKKLAKKHSQNRKG